MSRYAASLAHYRLVVTAQRIVQDITLAQSVAKTTSAGQSVAFTVGSSSYQLPGYAAPLSGPAQSSYTVNLTADPYQAALVSAVFGSSSTLSYDRFGQPSSGGTVVVKVGSFSSTVTVNATTGKASYQ